MDHNESVRKFEHLMIKEADHAQEAATELEALVSLLPTEKSRQLAQLQVKASHETSVSSPGRTSESFFIKEADNQIDPARLAHPARRDHWGTISSAKVSPVMVGRLLEPMRANLGAM